MQAGSAAHRPSRRLAFGAHDALQRFHAECVAGYADGPVFTIGSCADFIIVAVHWSQAGLPDRDGYLSPTIHFLPIEAT
ncbi:hypothetical protein [Burkholderia sp. Ac-20379]|uniref:hypothetical protein n=1 Tax=Burkholderia sp. Ac-20379 TaxID=2703900 RepID=UPI001981FCD6|nr:hypothetical protein [Burkholderia sp. Ac-20379]MBN3723364.1 hypothetical protein [Burkholderia sp. Ac-20379]